jgi:FtsP/CotA-like multicopper oxidase with cupredoxin domain
VFVQGSAALASLTLGGSKAAGGAVHAHQGPTAGPQARAVADHSLVIQTARIELGKNKVVSTTTYGGQFPGKLLRLTAGKTTIIDIRNQTDRPEQVHWHGQFLDASVDGAAEEGTPAIPARGSRRIAFTPNPTGFRFVHSHVTSGSNLTRGLFSGQFAPVFVDGRAGPKPYDREVFLILKEFAPALSDMEMSSGFLEPRNPIRGLYDLDQQAVRDAVRRKRGPGHQVSYRYYSVNGRCLGEGEPIRVKPGERVCFHVLNASASEVRSLALAGHGFRVIALDGNDVPAPRTVPVLWLGPGERVSAVVTMNAPGVWVMGDTDVNARTAGMGVVIEYASKRGPPVWRRPPRSTWDYRWFARPGAMPKPVDAQIELLFATRYSAQDGFDVFTINGQPFSMSAMQPRFPIRFGRRYRLRMRNATDDAHPIHLHRHSFEITGVAGFPTAGLKKDVAMIGPFQEMSVDFTADRRGLSLLHCHMQTHMDFGFMALFDCR